MIRLILLAGAGLILLAIPAGGLARPAAWEPDTRVVQDTSGAGQHETAIAVNPQNADNAVVVFKDYRAAERNYLDATTDGGRTWHEQPFAAVPGAPGNTDPAVFFRRDGRAYIIWTAEVDWPDAGLYCAWSDDGGRTWSAPAAITGLYGHYDDKAWLVFDATGGPHDGTIYVAWTRFGSAELAGIDAARSTDGGATWSPAVRVGAGAWAENDDGAQWTVQPDGALLLLFLHSNTDGTTTQVLARSGDGGATFGPGTALFTFTPLPYTLPGEHWRIFPYSSLAADPVRGWLSLVWADYGAAAANGADIMVSRSTDGGATWSPPIRLNDDPPGLVRDQWFPVLTAAPDGRLTALWLDRRDDPANLRYHAYARTSLDGGLTWLPSARLSSASSDPNQNIPPGSDGIGDYIGLAAGPGVVWGAWVDVRNGDQDIYAARERFTPAPSPTPTATVPSSSPVPRTPTPTLTPACTAQFSDVHPADYFSVPVLYLACHGVISGYADGSFRPYNQATRAQQVKIVVLGFGLPVTTPGGGAYAFADVPAAAPFSAVIETAATAHLVSGYACGGLGEPCDPQARPYFRPSVPVTRGQLAKIVTAAAGWPLRAPAAPTFADVPPGSTFYPFVETAAAHGVISGYACGGPGAPCDPQARPYFRPGAPATRGQIAKIVYLAMRSAEAPGIADDRAGLRPRYSVLGTPSSVLGTPQGEPYGLRYTVLGTPGPQEGRGAPAVPPPPLVTTAPAPRVPLLDPRFGANTRANTDATTYAHQEPSIAANPANPRNIIAAAKDERRAPGPGTATKEVWEYNSTDGGRTWANQPAPLPGPDAVRQSDPINLFRDDGVAYAAYLAYNDTGGFPDTGIVVTRSTDGGFAWDQTVLAVSEDGGYNTDKPWLAVDTNQASPFYHRMYLTWTEFGACNACIHFVYSTDEGRTWSPRSFQLSGGGGQQFAMPAVLGNGTVFVSWADGATIAYRLSTDGGLTFGAPARAGTMNSNLYMPGQNWRINTIPVVAADRSSPGRLVIVWNDGRSNALNGVDVAFVRSTDGGLTWTPPTRLNDDPPGVVKQQVEPWVTVGPNGTFHALWYDERDNTDPHAVHFHIYYTQSTDGGATWSPDIRASDSTTDLNIGIPQGPGWNTAAGDYINVTALDGDVYGAWTDTRSGTHEDIYTFHGVLPPPPPSPTPPDCGCPTATATPAGTDTPTPSATAMAPPSATTPPGTATGTPPPAGTGTPAPAPTGTPTSTFTAGALAIIPKSRIQNPRSPLPCVCAGPTPTPTLCPLNFSDVQPGDYFAVPVQGLACRGVVSGYADGTFRPYNQTTRAQMVKILVLGFGVATETPPPGAYTFADALPGSPFFAYIETAAYHSIVSGYTCGGPGEPCDPQARPYFRPYANVTRSQLAKITVGAAAWPVRDPAAPTFADVAPGSAFYAFVETVACHGLVSGYTCGGPGEPCDPQARPYFRPANSAIRGQIAKIVYGALTGSGACVPPGGVRG